MCKNSKGSSDSKSFTLTIGIFFRLIPGMKLDKAELKQGLNAVEQIAAVVRFARQNDLKVRAVGTGSSWSKLTNVRDVLIGE